MTNHVVFLGMVGLILALWPDAGTRTRLLRVQLVVVYLFGAISKVNAAFVTGDVIRARGVWIPEPNWFPLYATLAIAAIVFEALLALAIVSRWKWTLSAAAALHVGLTIGWTTDFLGHGPGILVFNLAVLAVVATSCDHGLRPRWVDRCLDRADGASERLARAMNDVDPDVVT